MELHRFDERFSLVLQGPVDIETALQELHAASNRAVHQYDSVEKSMAETAFTLSRDKKDFLQVTCDSPDDVWFLSDRLVLPGTFIRRLFDSRRELAFRCTLAGAERVVRHYLQLPREEFEALYSEGYTHNGSHQARIEPPAA